MTPSRRAHDLTVLGDHAHAAPVRLPFEVARHAHARSLCEIAPSTGSTSERHDRHDGERFGIAGKRLGHLEQHGTTATTDSAGDARHGNVDQASITQGIAHRDRKRRRRHRQATAVRIPVGLGQPERNLIELIHVDHLNLFKGWPRLGGELILDHRPRRVRQEYQGTPTTRRGWAR